jgi:hypothetical protein
MTLSLRTSLLACGLVACQVEAVEPGSGLAKSSEGHIDVDPQQVPVVPNCMEGDYVRRSATGWECAVPAGSGTVTQVTTGAGLVGGPITTSGTLGVNFGGNGTAAMAARADHTHAGTDPWMASGSNIYYMAGNVGIGTPTPSTTLDVVSNGTTMVKSESTGASADFRLVTSGTGGRTWILQTGNMAGGLNGRLRIYDLTAGAERVSIDASGHVGLGVVLPGHLLELGMDDAVKPNGGSWTAPSDFRLKKNVQPLGGSLARLLKLRGVSFEWKDPSQHGNARGAQIGMIAQEVERVFPDWVSTDAAGYKLLTYHGFEALTVESLRELSNENDRLREANRLLASRIERMESRLRDLERDPPARIHAKARAAR